MMFKLAFWPRKRLALTSYLVAAFVIGMGLSGCGDASSLAQERGRYVAPVPFSSGQIGTLNVNRTGDRVTGELTVPEPASASTSAPVMTIEALPITSGTYLLRGSVKSHSFSLKGRVDTADATLTGSLPKDDSDSGAYTFRFRSTVVNGFFIPQQSGPN